MNEATSDPKIHIRVILNVLDARILSTRQQLINLTSTYHGEKAADDTRIEMTKRMDDDAGGFFGMGGRYTPKDFTYQLSQIDLATKNLNALEESKKFLIDELLNKYIK